MAEQAEMPRDAKVVKTLLESMGVDEFEPRVINQFLLLWHRYVVDILTDAQSYSEHASKPTIDTDDIKLAIHSKLNFSFSQPPPRQALLELATRINCIPLPMSIGGPGLPLPPEADTLIMPNYQIALPSRVTAQAPPEVEMEEADNNGNGDMTNSQDQRVDNSTSQQRVSFNLPAKRAKLS